MGLLEDIAEKALLAGKRALAKGAISLLEEVEEGVNAAKKDMRGIASKPEKVVIDVKVKKGK